MSYLTEQTALVVGAGASSPYGFPTAGELKEIILGSPPISFKGLEDLSIGARSGRPLSSIFAEMVEIPALDRSRLGVFRKAFKESDLYSIDTFVFCQPQFEAIAKIYIALVLLLCEKRTPIPLGNWYQQFWNQVVRPSFVNESPRVDIVSFNYDRSLQLYLYQVALRAYADEKIAWEIYQKVRFSNVYGSLGPIYGDAAISFGSEDIISASGNIRLIPPRAEPNASVQDTLMQKDRLIFLGFGFDQLNVENLGITEDNRPRKMKIFASCFGLSRPLRKLAEERLGEIIWGDPGHKVTDFIHHSDAFV